MTRIKTIAFILSAWISLQNSFGQTSWLIQPATIINLNNYYIAQAAINAKQQNYEAQSSYLKKWSYTNKLLEEYKNRVVLPTKSFTITSKYGYRIHPITHLKQFHQGIDIDTNQDDIHSIFYGKITKIGYTSILGNYIEITGKEYTATYGHLSSILIEEGAIIYPNDIIGLSGTTGRSTGDHLHLTIKMDGKTIDPLQFFSDHLTKQQ